MRKQAKKFKSWHIFLIIFFSSAILIVAIVLTIFIQKKSRDSLDYNFTYKDPSNAQVTEHGRSKKTTTTDNSDNNLKITIVDQIIYCSDGRTLALKRMDSDSFNCIMNNASTAAVIYDSNSSYYIDTELRPIFITDVIQYGGFKLSSDGEKVLFANRFDNKFIMFYPHREAYYEVQLDDELEVETFANNTVLSPDFESIAFSTQSGTTVYSFETSTILSSKVKYKPLAITNDGKTGFFELYDKKGLYYFHDGQMDAIGNINVSEYYYVNLECTEILFYNWNEGNIWYFQDGMQEATMLLNHKPGRIFTSDSADIKTNHSFKNHLNIDSLFPLFIKADGADFYYFSDLNSEPVVVSFSEIKDDKYMVNATNKGVEIIYVYDGAGRGSSGEKDNLYSLQITKDGYSKKHINEGKREYIAGYTVTNDFSNIYVWSIDLSIGKAVIRRYSDGESLDLAKANDYRDLKFTYSSLTGKLCYCMDGILYSISDGDNTSIPECDNAKKISSFWDYEAFPCYIGTDERRYAYIFGNVVKIRK